MLRKSSIFPLFLLLFLITSTIMVDVSHASTLEVTVKTNKDPYILRETVEISGNVTFNSQLVDSGLVGVQIENPVGVTVATRTLALGSNINENWPLEIIDFTPCDDVGAPKQTFLREEWAYFKVSVKNKGITSRDVTITITVCDNSTIPMQVLAGQQTIPAGQNVTVGPALWIPNWAKNGTGIAYADLYSDWPKNEGRPYCPENLTTFSILDSEYDESTPSPPSYPPYQDGEYNMNFRLSPEPKPGLYTVSSTAWYKGYKTLASTPFQVTEVPAPPWPYFVMKPPVAGPGYEVTFDASASSAEGYGDSITNYSWDFGDNQNGTGKVVKHTYTDVGNYIVTLNVTDIEGFWNTTTRTAPIATLPDVAVTSIECLNEIYDNWEVKVSVEVKNKGTITESFNVTLSANSTFIGIQQVTNLEPFESKTLTFTWNTTGLILLANYTLKAQADTVPGETQTTDNTLEYGLIFVRMMGDVRFDRKIDILDVVAVTSVYGSKEGDDNWDIMADLTPDGKIDILDVVRVTSKYGRTY